MISLGNKRSSFSVQKLDFLLPTMSEVSSSELTRELAKPVESSNSNGESDTLILPPFPEPGDDDFEDDIGEEEREYYKSKFPDLNAVRTKRLHCSACDCHMGCSAKNESRMRSHPMLRTLMCHKCHTFYNSGEFEKGDDGSELYCRWCGQGGQVYCCSDCEHVFCAKCIKRNLGVQKIHEIESTDDWKCLKCNPRDLWELRALCWALLRFCDLKNKLVYKTEDPDLKEKYQKDCAVDSSECCRDKRKRGPKKKEEPKKEMNLRGEQDSKKITSTIISKIPQGIQVKKFASINANAVKPEKKAIKRSASPKVKPTIMKNPIAIHNQMPQFQPYQVPTKKVRIQPMAQTNINPFGMEKSLQFRHYTPRIMQRPPQQPNHYPIQVLQPYNGYNNVMMNDNINLSLETLTQGLDMAAVAAARNNNNNRDQNDELVCTPDFPLEPMCEVTEDNDDDVQCITPAPARPPAIAPKPQPVLVKKNSNISPENIVQMTENDVTVNAATGGLKFRVDPQTLSSNKMYRLPDGRIFAINCNPNMPGGYSATIVAVTESASPAPQKSVPRGATYAAKVCPVPSLKQNSTPSPVTKVSRTPNSRSIVKPQRNRPKVSKASTTNVPGRKIDLEVPVEWYRYNLVDAYDSLEYSLSRLRKLKKEVTTMYLRSRSVDEMRTLHKTLDRLLQNSAVRFNEVRDNLSKGMKQFIMKKSGVDVSDDDNADDDDDVEILNENDDPIFIDENSMESNNASKDDNQEVDLVSSDFNDSGDKEAAKRKKADTTAESNGALEEFLSVENGDISITKNYKPDDDKGNSADSISKEISLSDNEISVDKDEHPQKGDKDGSDADEMEVTTTDFDVTQDQTRKDTISEPKQDIQDTSNIDDQEPQAVENNETDETKQTNDEPELDDEKTNNATVDEEVAENAQKDTNEINDENVLSADDKQSDEENDERSLLKDNNEPGKDISQEDETSDEKTFLKDTEGPDKDISQENEISDELIETLLSDAGDDVLMETFQSNPSEPDSILP